MSELGNPKKPPLLNDSTTAASGFTTISPGRSPAKSINDACPEKIPPSGTVRTVVKPALRQVSIRDGMRETSARALLRPALSRPNLQVLTDLHATRIVLEGRYRLDGRRVLITPEKN